MCRELELLQSEGQKQQEAEVTLNYEQYYPTVLPIRQPGMEETDEEAHARDDRPPDLSQHQVFLTSTCLSGGCQASTVLAMLHLPWWSGLHVASTCTKDSKQLQAALGSLAYCPYMWRLQICSISPVKFLP